MKQSTFALMILSLIAGLFCISILQGCGDSRGPEIDTNGQYQPTLTNEQNYQGCLSRNPNYQYSPAWYYWNDQCRRQYNIATPYAVNYVNQVDN